MQAFYVHPLGVDFFSSLITVLIIHQFSLFGLRLQSRILCTITMIFLIHHKNSVQFHPIANLGKKEWRRGVGVEPTRDRIRPHTGFEGQETHRDLYPSAVFRRHLTFPLELIPVHRLRAGLFLLYQNIP